VAVAARAAGYETGSRQTTLNDAAGEALTLLARGVQQYHTYPPQSPLCRTAVEACGRALAALEHRDQLTFRIAPTEIVLDEAPFGRGTIVEHELARRLHATSVAEVTIERTVTPRELAHFFLDLVQCSERHDARDGFIDVLANHGVERIALRPAERPAVLAVPTPGESTLSLVTAERRRRQELLSAGGHISHLYPPDKGWVRVDPALGLDSVSLVELALLTGDPAALANMLLRLTDDVDETQAAGDALERKFSDVATLFGALEPRLARMMFSRLAEAVLHLAPDSRQALLRRTILPGLLDGRMDGTVLRDFPDVELADSLCLLLDLETAAPELVASALARLDLPADRQASVLPLIERRLGEPRASDARDAGLDAHARRLLKVDPARPRSFAEFAAFDLALDPPALDALADARARIATEDTLEEPLRCLYRLCRLEPNPDAVQTFLRRSVPHLLRLETEACWRAFADWLLRYRGLVDDLAEARPDVTAAVAATLESLSTTERAQRLVALAASGGPEADAAATAIRALGAPLGPGLLAVVRTATGASREALVRAATLLLSEQAGVMAPALVASLGSGHAACDRLVIRICGLAGAGYETPVGAQLRSGDDQTVREALRSLARIGTREAAALIAREIAEPRGWIGAAAEETLWRFPAPEAARQTRMLLAQREFAIRHPELAARLLDRLGQSGVTGLEPVLRSLSALRFRIWNPALVRLARRARALLKR